MYVQKLSPLHGRHQEYRSDEIVAVNLGRCNLVAIWARCESLRPSHSGSVAEKISDKKVTCRANAALEWQAGSLGWRSRELVEACPLEGLVRSVAFPQATTADLRTHSKISSNQAKESYAFHDSGRCGSQYQQ